jgi:N-acetylglucosamine PTS system EIICBA or EIICB component
VLTGAAMVLMNVLHVKLGFGFSAGLFDYVLSFNRATRPLLLIPIGAIYFALYYGLFHYCIVRFNLKTPGRDTADTAESAAPVFAGADDRARGFIKALGGAENLTTVDACTTRLRLIVVDNRNIDEPALRQLGARGFMRPSANGLQIILGPIADQVAGDIRAALKSPGSSDQSAMLSMSNLLKAIGGASNVRDVAAVSTRLCFTLNDPAVIDDAALATLPLRGIARPSPTSLHALVGADANAKLSELRRLITV